ncbi:MAG: acyltransferase family protein, partial [Chitinophagales bacterium]
MEIKDNKIRLRSLDFFRGLTVAGMILVNNPGDWAHIYAPLEHSVWNGYTPTDLVFPFFLFIVGVSIVYAMATKKADPAKHRAIMLKAARRSLTIYVLFLLLVLIPKFDFQHLRLLGVLPRIAIVFFICTLLFLKTSRKTQVWIFWSILIAYYLIMNFIPVPGIGPSNLDPSTNLAAWLDRLVLTPNHIWSQSKTFDPEGILSTLPAISTCMLGIFTGGWLQRNDQSAENKVAWLFSVAALLITGGLIWNGFFPVNKALWTSSFVLFTGGLAMATLTLSYWLIDVNRRQKFTEPFVAFGSNAITIYVVSGYLPELIGAIPVKEDGLKSNLWQYGYHHLFTSWLSPVNAS